MNVALSLLMPSDKFAWSLLRQHFKQGWI